jgi:hypothetical protein
MQFDVSFHIAAGGIINNICGLPLNIEMQANNLLNGTCFKTGFISVSTLTLVKFWRKKY